MDPIQWREQVREAVASFDEAAKSQWRYYREDADKAQAGLDTLLDAARDEMASLQAALGQQLFPPHATCPVCGLEHERGDFGDYCSEACRAPHLSGS